MEKFEKNSYLLPDLKDKVVIITGGASGIGKSIAIEFFKQGSFIGLLDIDEKKGNELIREWNIMNKRIIFVKCDITKEDEVNAGIKKISEYFNGVDILINNAGITFTRSLENLSIDEWKRILEVNLTGAFICTKAVVPYLLKRKGGSIIMISSGSAITGSGGSAAYAASKGGINSLVRSLSRELAPKGIRVNGVAPRSIQGELLEELYSYEEIELIRKRIPLRRLGTENDVAHVVLFLASDLSGFITGEIILVDGGRTYGT